MIGVTAVLNGVAAAERKRRNIRMVVTCAGLSQVRGDRVLVSKP